MLTPQALMSAALEQAQIAVSKGEIPVGAVIANAHGEIIARAHNLVETQQNPLAHAEMLALQQVIENQQQKYLEGCTLAVTLEPCAMCAQALAHARISSIIFGAYDPKSGGTESGARIFQHSHHKPTLLGGIEEQQCRALLKNFFANLRS